MFLILVVALLASTAANVTAAAPSRATSPSSTVTAALITLQSHLDVANHAMGEDGAEALGKRLADDLENLDDTTPLDGWPQAAYDERLRNVAALDASIVDQVVHTRRDALRGTTGLAERFTVSRVDGTWQPYTLYVPKDIGPRPALVVLLHGRPQTESELLGGPYFRTLADATHTIIAAPWGRGHYDYYGVATDDVYQTASEVASAFAIDPKRIYLAGYSMGGFSVFKVGPVHGSVWASVMCISGAILNSETNAVRSAWSKTPVYVVNGKLDDNIPQQYGLLTAEWLAGVGIPTGFYQAPTGTHMLPTLMTELTQAWSDMLAGVVHNKPPAAEAVSFPTPPQMIPGQSGVKP